MRRLELAGELVAGRFFAGIDSLQFASPRIITELEEAQAAKGIYWMNAADPASPAGLSITGLDPRLPSRLAASRLCFRGSQLLAVSGRGGKTLEIFLPPDEVVLEEALGFLAVQRTRPIHPQKKVLVESINGISAAASPYAPLLKHQGFVPDRGKLVLW
jgi:ATP-dependent Lhr-like helicase